MNHPTPNDATRTNSYVPLSRGLDEHLPGFPPAALKVYLHLLINAKFSGPFKGKVARNLGDLALELRMSYSQVWRAINWLRDTAHTYIDCQPAKNQHGVTAFTILRYKSVSDFAHVKNDRSDDRSSEEAADKQRRGSEEARPVTDSENRGLPDPKNGSNGKNGENVIPSVCRKRKPRVEVSSSFDAFWTAYPRKIAKEKAWKAFRKINPNAELLAEMLRAIEIQSGSRQWQREGGQYIPHPATWLNGRRWEDELEPTGITGGTNAGDHYAEVPSL